MESQQKQAKNLYFIGLANDLVSSLPERSQEIIKKRFGLFAKGKGETLEKIGKDYGITRERVRQIIYDSLKKISQRKNNPEFKLAKEKIILAINARGGIIKEEEALKSLGRGIVQEENAIRFIVDCSSSIKRLEEKGCVEVVWFLSEEVIEMAKKIENVAKNVLEKERDILDGKELAKRIIVALGDKEFFNEKKVIDFLNVLSCVKSNSFGRWGLSVWPQVSPKGTRDKIYLILKEKKTPLHFTKIAELIDELGLAKKKAHPQTVHNELIKDKRFVLVGRGIYALKEWGYEKGTIKDVITDILEKSGPMEKDAILDQVFQKRKVKKSTVMINLNNAKFFQKVNGRYALKK